jgi:hypothetical protein
MPAKKNREINVFGLSFMDVLANTIGGLAFLLIMAMLMVGDIVRHTPPRIVTESLPEAYQERDYSVWLSAQGGNGRFFWQLAGGELPPGLQLDAQSGRLHGRVLFPGNQQVGRQFEFEVACSTPGDSRAASTTPGQPKSDRKRLALTVSQAAPFSPSPLRIVSDSDLPAAYRGQPYPLAFAAEGGQAPYRWAWRGTTPAGMTLAADGRITGSPTQNGKFEFEVGVITSQGERQFKPFALLVSEKFPPPPPVPPLKVATRLLPAAVADQNYAVQPAAEGGTPPFTWRSRSASPSWLTFDPVQGAFVGRPSVEQIGKTQVEWDVVDAKGQTATSEPISLEVLPPVGKKPLPLVIKTRQLPELRVGQAYHLALSVSGGQPPYRFAADPPASDLGIRFDANEGVFAGEALRRGRWETRVRVSDDAGRSASVELSLTVRPAYLPPEILTNAATDGRVGRTLDLALSARGGYSPFRWWIVSGNLPPGVSLDADDGRIVGNPSEAGSWKAMIAAEDAEQQAVAKPVELPLVVLTRQGVTRLEVKTTSLPPLLVGEALDLAFSCEGGQPPYQCDLVGTSLPGLGSQGIKLAGVPTQAGNFVGRFRLRDSSGQSQEIELPISIRSVAPRWWVWLLAGLFAACVCVAIWLWRAARRGRPQSLVVNTPSIPNARASSDYAVQLSCFGGVQPYAWRIIEGELPSGLTLSESGLLHGRPLEGIPVQETKEFQFLVEVCDAIGNRATARL